mgnify:CR=1 FL=1
MSTPVEETAQPPPEIPPPDLSVPKTAESAVSKELWRLYEASGLKAKIENIAAQLVNNTFTQRPTGRTTRTHHEDPYAVLGVSPGDSREMVDAVFRAKARILHPDKGGNAAAFTRLKLAYDLIRKGGKT